MSEITIPKALQPSKSTFVSQPGIRLITLLDQIFALLTTPFPVPRPPAYQRLLRSYK